MIDSLSKPTETIAETKKEDQKSSLWDKIKGLFN